MTSRFMAVALVDLAVLLLMAATFSHAALWAYRTNPRTPGGEDKLGAIRADVQKDIKKVEKKVHETRDQIHQDLLDKHNQITTNIEQSRNKVQREAHRLRKKIKKGVRQHVFSQRVGWDLVLHSILNHAGMLFGGALVLNGSIKDPLPEAAVSLEVALLTFNLSMLFLETQHNELIASVLAGASWVARKTLISVAVPPLFLSLYLFHTVGTILDPEAERTPETKNVTAKISRAIASREEGRPQTHASFPTVGAIAATIFALVGLKYGDVPISMASSALSGSLLLCESVASEIHGNWVNMIHHLHWFLSRIIVPILKPILQVLIKQVIRPILRLLGKALWKGFQFAVSKCFQTHVDSEDAKNRVRKAVRKIRSMAVQTWKSIRSFQAQVQSELEGLPVVRDVLRLLSAIQDITARHKSELIPIAIASAGIARQKGWVTSLGDLRRVYKAALNPVKTGTDIMAETAKSIGSSAVKEPLRQVHSKFADRTKGGRSKQV